MKNQINFGFPEDIEWLRNQAKALKLLLSLPSTPIRVVGTIADRIEVYEYLTGRMERNLRLSKKKSTGGLPKKVYQYTTYGQFIRAYSSVQAAGKAIGVTGQNISSAAIGLKGQKTAAGYVWRYNRK